MGQRLRSTREIRDTSYSPDATVRSWYKSARWRQLRQQVFLRDLYKCQRSGVLAIGKHPEPNSPVANHKIPHHGDPDLFWDIDNIETVTKAIHDSLIQSQERNAHRR
jgi:5-methylcytosine-specific restriction endonuclease McrA